MADLIKQPSSLDCFVCGVKNPIGLHLEFFETESGEVICDHIIPENYQGYPGVAHGGIVASMVDEVLGRVHMGNDPNNPRFMYTARLTVHYRKPVPVEKPIRIIGRPVKVKAHSATSRAQVLDENGELLAEADAVLVDIPKSMFDDVDLYALGWKVYD
ncbi:MAG: PaaI family thioesterase [Anaerolineales bacterium]|nr:PaaI family thioesterase [Anaerolineales bacterium]HEY61162.1 PaaI family thioesterase [Anaerolineae bacterium]